MMIKNNDQVEAYQVSQVIFHRIELMESGRHQLVHGSKSVKSLMLSDKVENSSTKEKNTITYSTWM